MNLLLVSAVLACGSQAGDGGTMDGGTMDGGTPVPDATVLVCSDDLHDLLDSNGDVIETCPIDEGCSEGACIPACEAAAKSEGNVGCDFYVSTPHFYTPVAPPCFAAFVTNNWGSAAGITMTRDGLVYDVAQFGRIADGATTEAQWASVPSTGLPENEVAVLFLSQDPSSVNFTPLTCPVPPAVSTGGGTAAGFGSPAATSTMGKAWRIQTDVPVSLYDILPYGGAASFLPSAQLVMPTSALGDTFVVSLPKPSNSGSIDGSPWLQVVASENDTTISVLPTIDFPAGIVPAAISGTTSTFTIQAGEYLQWQFPVNSNASGAIINSDKPIATIGGDTYICYSSATSAGGGCDSSHQVIPPVSAMGMEYVASPHKSRGPEPESIWYRITGVVDGSMLTYDPPIAGAPATLNRGEVVDVESTLAFAVSTQDIDHPIHLAQTMSGAFVAGSGQDHGDEEFVNTLPPAQFLRQYVFFTDPSYVDTTLSLTRVANSQGEFADVTIGCSGVVTGWVAVGTEGKFEVATVDLVLGGVGQQSCVNGSQTARSDLPFGITVWGLAQFASYAYPAGGNATTINEVVIVID
ncbi:MAG: hypothetical protein GY811_06775 [Myxococcales bacterium]|nr:hypothetical protein [Myxococcales bacterium]